MNGTLRRVLRSRVFWVLCGVCVLSVAVVEVVTSPAFRLYLSADARRRTVLYETDHQALLDACREMIVETGEGKWKGILYVLSDKEAGMGMGLPAAISQLGPTHVIPNSDRVRIEMLGGAIGHAGVIAFMDDAPADLLELGDRELIDGLWYYDDCYDTQENWDAHIESLKPQP